MQTQWEHMQPIDSPVAASTDGDRIIINNKPNSVPWNEGISINKSLTFFSAVDNDHFFVASPLSLYPNPTDGKFTIGLGDFKDLVTLTFRDVRGRLLQTSEHTNVETIDLFVEYPTGMYFLEITSNNENAVLRLVLK